MVHKGNGRNEVFNGGIRLVSGGKVLVGERVSLLVERDSEEKPVAQRQEVVSGTLALL